jgi:hypothetical protein
MTGRPAPSPLDPTVKRWLQALLWVGVAVLLAAELIDDLKLLRGRLAHHVTSWWTRVERRERRGARHTQMAALASRIDRRRPR